MSKETKDRPILFSGPMVRAILGGHKTQTRRIVKPQPPNDHPYPQECMSDGYWWNDDDTDRDDLSFWPSYDKCLPCPYGMPGDQLWVRESHALLTMMDGAKVCAYRASCDDNTFNYANEFTGNVHCIQVERWRPSIHMPRKASRITLEIAAVRVERLQDITRGDCMAEGCPFPNMAKLTDPKEWFTELWESINGNWDANPWVWVVEFKQIQS